jgi:putative membrane protein
VWLGADEIGVPAAGLSGPPTQYPLSVHLNALAGHIAYGMTTELVRRRVRAVL